MTAAVCAAAGLLLAGPSVGVAQAHRCPAARVLPASVRATLEARRERDRSGHRFARLFTCDADFSPPRVRFTSAPGRSTVPTVTVRFTADDEGEIEPGASVTLDGAELTVSPEAGVDSVRVVNPLGDGRSATTRYVYGDPAWPDFVTRAILPAGEVTETAYDPTTGNVVWVQPGTPVPAAP